MTSSPAPLRRARSRVLSDGSPWRPLIDVRDMARAIDWGITRSADDCGRFLALNVGSNDRNYQVKDLANAVAEAVSGTKVSINKAAQPDTRSYQVDFSLFRCAGERLSAAGNTPPINRHVGQGACADGVRRPGLP